MPTLLETQRALRGVLMRADDGADSGIASSAGTADSSGGHVAPLLAIHRNTVTSALVNALALTFPAVRQLVGAEFFEGAAREFIAQHPPASAYLNDYGAALPGFLAAFPPAMSLPYLGDVARLEWAFSRALQASDVPPLNLAQLAELDEEATGSLRFVPHPSLSLLRLALPADRIWSAVLAQDDAALRSIDIHAGEALLLVERGTQGAQVRRMQESAWRFTERLCRGLALRDALTPDAADTARDINADDRAEEYQALLADHLVSGRFTSFTFS